MKWVGYTTPDYKRKKNRCFVSFSWHSTTVHFRRTRRWNYSGRHWSSSTLGRPNTNPESFSPSLDLPGRCSHCSLQILHFVYLSSFGDFCPWKETLQFLSLCICVTKHSLYRCWTNISTFHVRVIGYSKSSITEELATGNIMWNVTF